MQSEQAEVIPWHDNPVASTDFGNVSKFLPSMHPCFQVSSLCLQYLEKRFIDVRSYSSDWRTMTVVLVITHLDSRNMLAGTNPSLLL